MTEHYSQSERELGPPADPTEQESAQAADPEERRPAIGETVGTGTSIALGCIAGTMVLVLIGLLFLVILMLLG